MADSYYNDETSTFGDRVAAAREAAGLNRAQLARRIGVKAATVDNWEADRSEPRANKLQMLAGLLNVSMVWLMTGEGEGVTPPGDGPSDATIGSIITELRDARASQIQLAERLARLEKKLRGLSTAI